jgi:mannan endo-1,4-beta-mannosidase
MEVPLSHGPCMPGSHRARRPVREGRESRVRIVIIAVLALAACRSVSREPLDARIVDPHATNETKALFLNLQHLSRDRVLFGHQDALAYGVEWTDAAERSDVKDVTGSFPAVYGWDASGIERDSKRNIDGVQFARMRDWIEGAYSRGGVITLSWHMNNPASGGNAWDTTAAVAAILPGGARYDQYRLWLDGFAEYVSTFRASRPGVRGEQLVPIIFRPFHEMSGGWFWWGAGHCSPDEYKALWRFTVSYLRDTKQVHNLLWAYSPNAQKDGGMSDYFAYYPGDEFVDILGFDDYSTLEPHPGSPDPVAAMRSNLRWLGQQAATRGKVAALTEAGYVTIPDSMWWTSRLLPALAPDSGDAHVAYALVWRNANRVHDRPDHFYAPYPGQASAADFVRFRADPGILFEDELPDMYRAPRR